MSVTRIGFACREGAAQITVEVIARSTYVVEVPWTGEARAALVGPDGEIREEARLSIASETRAKFQLLADAGEWTLELAAYGGSGGGAGDSLSYSIELT